MIIILILQLAKPGHWEFRWFIQGHAARRSEVKCVATLIREDNICTGVQPQMTSSPVRTLRTPLSPLLCAPSPTSPAQADSPFPKLWWKGLCVPFHLPSHHAHPYCDWGCILVRESSPLCGCDISFRARVLSHYLVLTTAPVTEINQRIWVSAHWAERRGPWARGKEASKSLDGLGLLQSRNWGQFPLANEEAPEKRRQNYP